MQNRSHAVMAQRTEPPDSADNFPTPPWATRALLEHVIGDRGPFNGNRRAFEPACGAGHMARPLAEYFGEVHASISPLGSRRSRPPGAWDRVFRLEIEHILHAGDVLAVDLRNAPRVLTPRLRRSSLLAADHHGRHAPSEAATNETLMTASAPCWTYERMLGRELHLHHPALIEVMKKVLEDTMTRVPSEHSTPQRRHILPSLF